MNNVLVEVSHDGGEAAEAAALEKIVDDEAGDEGDEGDGYDETADEATALEDILDDEAGDEAGDEGEG